MLAIVGWLVLELHRCCLCSVYFVVLGSSRRVTIFLGIVLNKHYRREVSLRAPLISFMGVMSLLPFVLYCYKLCLWSTCYSKKWVKVLRGWEFSTKLVILFAATLKHQLMSKPLAHNRSFPGRALCLLETTWESLFALHVKKINVHELE